MAEYIDIDAPVVVTDTRGRERETTVRHILEMNKGVYTAADVRPVTVCTNCEHNNHCLTQEFVEDCGKIPLDRNTFFCADGERRNNA